MLEEGYAAATSRRIAAKAGVKPALVHYYFPSMDDLFLAVFRAGGDANLQRQREALTDERPLHTLWQLNSAQASRLLMEFMALANHRKAIRTELAAYAERFRDMEEAALTLVLRTNGIDVEEFPPVVMAMIMGSLARILTMEQSLGITRGHDQAHAFIERFLSRFDLPAS
jgi:AcrR family transcriptional regulator